MRESSGRITEPPQIIHFGAPRPATPKPAVRPPPEEPVAPSARRVGGPAGGGYFGLKGVYVLTRDGYLHEQIMATGLDYAPPVRFLPAPNGSSFALNMSDKVVYTVAGSNCENVPRAVWSIDLNTPDYGVSNYHVPKLTLTGLTGPAIGSDGTAYIVTGSGPAGAHPNSVVALTAKSLKVKDWYTPPAGGKALEAGPVVFPYKGKELVAAPGKDGSLVLLDSKSLGGSDHQTPLAETDKLSRGAKRGARESLATWQDKAGAFWVFASISGAGRTRHEICRRPRPRPAWQHRCVQGGRERRPHCADTELDFSRSHQPGTAGDRQRGGPGSRRRK